MTLLAGAMSVYSQGTISLNDIGSFAIQVWGLQSAAASTVAVIYNGYAMNEEQGDGGDLWLSNPGNTVYAAGNPLGAGYTVQLLEAAGAGDALSALQPVPAANGGTVTTWFTGLANKTGTGYSLAGFWDTGSVAIIPGGTGAATLAVAVWDNEGGAVTTLAQAQANDAASPNSDPWGISSLGSVNLAVTIPPYTPGQLPQVGNPSGELSYISGGVESFSLGLVVPEPCTVALGVIGASAFLFRRRK